MTINNYRAHWISGVIMECIIEESSLQMIEIFSIWKNHLYSYVNVLIYFFKNIVLFVRKLFSWFHNSKQSCQSPLKWWNSTNVLCREKQTINVVFDQLSMNRKQKWKHEIRKAFRIEMFVVLCEEYNCIFHHLRQQKDYRNFTFEQLHNRTHNDSTNILLILKSWTIQKVDMSHTKQSWSFN